MKNKKLINGIQSLKQPHRLLFFKGVLVGALACWIMEFAANQATLSLQLASDNGKSLYTLGQLYARHIDSMRLTSREAQVISQGFQDWGGHKISRIDFDSHRSQLESLMESRQTSQIQITKKEGQEYLKNFVRSGGVQSLSGLAYRVIVPGSAKKPTLKDWVEVSYRGTLVDGKVIDATSDTKPKANLPMNGVISGWTEGLQLIGEGGEIELVVPSELAYGEVGTSSDVPPGATLLFRVRLHKVLDSGRVNPSS